MKAFLLCGKHRRRHQGAAANPAGLHRRQTFGRAAGLHDSHVFAWIKSKTGKRIARHEISRAAETGDCDRAAFELFRSFDFWLGHQPVVQGRNAADDVDRLGAGEAGTDDPRSGGLNDRRVARSHCGNR